MLDIWSDFLSLLSLVAGVVGSILIFESFFHRRWERSILWLALILAAVNQLSSKFAYMDIHTRTAAALGSCLCNALIVMVFYRARWDRALFVSVAGYALFSVPNYWIDWGAMQLFDLTHFQLIWNIPLYSVVFVIKSVSCSAIGLVVWLLHKPLPDSDATPRVWVPLVTIFPVLTLVAFYAVYTRGERQWQGVLLVLDVVDVAVLLLFDRLERSAIDREALVAARERARLQDENLQALSQAYSAQRKLTHDFRACLTTLSGMLEQGNVEQAQRYLEELKIRQTERILLVNTHNAAIDAVLNQKGYAAQKRGLDLRFRVNDLSALRLEPVDATLVLGNLLDNAMEACTALPERGPLGGGRNPLPRPGQPAQSVDLGGESQSPGPDGERTACHHQAGPHAPRIWLAECGGNSGAVRRRIHLLLRKRPLCVQCRLAGPAAGKQS